MVEKPSAAPSFSEPAAIRAKRGAREMKRLANAHNDGRSPPVFAGRRCHLRARGDFCVCVRRRRLAGRAAGASCWGAAADGRAALRLRRRASGHSGMVLGHLRTRIAMFGRACDHDQTALAAHLLANDRVPRQSAMRSAFVRACSRGRTAMAQWLWAQGMPATDAARRKGTSFKQACGAGHTDTVAWYLATIAPIWATGAARSRSVALNAHARANTWRLR